VSLASFSQTLVKGELPEDFLKNWREKVFILTDRGYYNSGDTIWLKALFKYSNPSNQDSLSKVLHVDLYTPSKILVSKSKFKIKNGLVASGIGIPDQLPPDTYFLVAYTSWMLNFGEYFIKPLPIGEIGKYGKANPTDTISGVPEGLKIKVDLPDYINPRENVTLKIKAMEETESIKSLSVSLTSLSSSAGAPKSPTILSFNSQFLGDGLKTLFIKHKIETAIVHKGKVHKVFNEQRELNPVFKDEVVVKAFVPLHKKIYMSQPIVNGKFEIGFDYVDTASVSFAGETKKGLKYGDIEILPQDTLKANFVLPNLEYEQDNYTSPTMPKQFAKDSKILKEVTVKARKIEPKRLLKLPIPPIPLGFAQKTSKVEDVKSMRLMNTLQNAIQYMVRGQEIEVIDDDGRPLNIFYFGANRGTISYFRFYLNGVRTYYNDLRLMPTVILSRIEVYGSEGSSGFASGIYRRESLNPLERNPEDRGGPIAGSVMIYTEPFVDANLNPQAYTVYQLKGYDKQLDFKEPTASRLLNYRPTVYWNPSVQFNAQREAIINFTSTDFEGPFKLTIEGITDSGKPVRVVKILNDD
jgi:hypothetical protein